MFNPSIIHVPKRGGLRLAIDDIDLSISRWITGINLQSMILMCSGCSNEDIRREGMRLICD